MEDIFIMLEIPRQEASDTEYKNMLVKKTKNEIRRINQMETQAKMSKMAKVIARLLSERDMGINEEILRLVLCSKNKMRDYINEERENG